MNAICLVIDRLHAGYLGCYGNSWVVTPEFNRLAAESFLFDQAIIDAPELASLYRSWWFGQHAYQSQANLPLPESLPARLQAAGIATTLWTDDPSVNDALPASVTNSVSIESAVSRLPTQPAIETRKAHCGVLFDRALTWLESAPEPFLLWLHSGSLGLTWDAPRAVRDQYVSEEDPESSRGVEVPRLVLPPNYDPDDLLSIAQAYAGQVSVLDEHLGHFLNCLRDSSLAANTLVVVVGARGLALGEHRRVGAWDEALQSETIHVPWLLRNPDGVGALNRSSALVQPSDLGPTLLEWFGILGQGDFPNSRSLGCLVRDELSSAGAARWRDRACTLNTAGERGIRSKRWYLRQAVTRLPGDESTGSMGEETQERPYHWLYAKPDDRFEVNEVSNRAPETTALLAEAEASFARLAAANDLAALAPLDESLDHPPS